MINFEESYFETIEEIMTYGKNAHYNNNGAFNIFSTELQINLLEEGFPLIKTNALNIKDIIIDTIGNVKGINNNKWFRVNGCKRYLRAGLPFKEVKQVQKEDHELIDEYCSCKNQYSPTSVEYMERFRKLKSVSVKEGLELIDKEDITFWKDVIIKERGDLGITKGYLWRNYPGKQGEKIDQLKNAFEHLKSENKNKGFIVYSQSPLFAYENNLTVTENIVKGNVGNLCSDVSHIYYTSPISTLDRTEIYNKNFKNKLKVDHTNLKVIDKKLDQLNIPKYYLDISFQQLNWDFIKDAPVDIASYGVLLLMMSKKLNMVARNIEVKANNVFIYKKHIEVVTEMFNRISNNGVIKNRVHLSLVDRDDVEFIDQFNFDDFLLKGYSPLSEIKIPLIKTF